MFRLNADSKFHKATALVTAASFVLALGGCAHLPKTGTEANGEQLNVEVKTETHTYVTQAKVGEVQHRDSAGRVVGTSEVYENRTGQYDVTKWQVFQGDEPIDDQDFYTIAGDTRSAEEIAKQRQSGVSLNHIGLGLAIGGGVAAIGGVILGPALETTDANGYTERPAWPTYLMSLGMITATVGGIMAFYGAAKTNRQHPIDDPDKANRAATRYNKLLASGQAPTAKQADDEEEPKPKPKKKKKKKKHVEEDDDE